VLHHENVSLLYGTIFILEGDYLATLKCFISFLYAGNLCNISGIMLISVIMIPRSSHGYGTHFVEKVNSSQNSGYEFVAFQSCS
jgi:hypothetical protein